MDIYVIFIPEVRDTIENSVEKKNRFFILVRNMLFRPILYFYQVSSKYY